MLAPFQTFDGYELLRPIGKGGFGEVWLCRSQALGDYRAFKFIASDNPAMLEKEFHSLLKYRNSAGMLRSPHLLPVEHANRVVNGLYYIMPLADGLIGEDPARENWAPATLSAKIDEKLKSNCWFSSDEIKAIIEPILRALQLLSDAGLVHRDVKPDNILFLSGQPCLGDISLLVGDSGMITRRGTPGYLAPSWYVAGLPDMYGAAATLYTLLTGNLPDKMGRSAFNWPPQGEISLTPAERSEWKRLHAVVRRATEESPSERFRDFTSMQQQIASPKTGWPSSHQPPPLAAARITLRLRSFFSYLISHPKETLGAVAAVGFTICRFTVGWGNWGDQPLKPIFPEEKRPNPQTAQLEEQLVKSVIKELDAKNFAVALEQIDSLLRCHPPQSKLPFYSFLRAASLIGLKRRDEAVTELKNPVNITNDNVSIELRMSLWCAMGDLAGAEEDLTRVTRRLGPSTFCLYKRAEVRAQMKNFTGVEADRLAALRACSQLPETKQASARTEISELWNSIRKKFPDYAHYAASGP